MHGIPHGSMASPPECRKAVGIREIYNITTREKEWRELQCAERTSKWYTPEFKEAALEIEKEARAQDFGFFYIWLKVTILPSFWGNESLGGETGDSTSLD